MHGCLRSNTSRLHEVRGIQRKQEGQADQEWQQGEGHEATLQDKEPTANEKVSKAGKGTAKIGRTGSELHVTDVKIDDLIAPYLGIHDVDFRVVEKPVHSGVYHAVRSELESFLPVADAKAGAQLKAREATEHWRTLWTNSDQEVE